jgi:phosphate:Na+ symporter
VRLEIARMGEIVQQMLTGLRTGWLERDRGKLEEVQMMDDQVDVLESEILKHLGAIRTQSLTEQESTEVALAMKVADGFESVGDVIETDLVRLGYRALDENLQASDAMRVLFSELGDKLSTALDSTIRAVREDDERAADEVLTIKADIDHLIGKALELQSQALAQVGPEQIELMRVEMTVLENFKRIHTLLKRVARDIVPQAVRA